MSVDGICRNCRRRKATTRRRLPDGNGEWGAFLEPVCRPCAGGLDRLGERLARGVAQVDRAVRGYRGGGGGAAA